MVYFRQLEREKLFLGVYIMITKELMIQELHNTMAHAGVDRKKAVEIMLLVHDNDVQSNKCRSIARQSLREDGLDTLDQLVFRYRLPHNEEAQAWEMYHASNYADIKKWSDKDLDTLRTL